MRQEQTWIIVWAMMFGAACGQSSTASDATVPGDGGPIVDGGGVDSGPGPCSPVGSMRTVPCGNCGLAQQVCGAAGLWDPPGVCLGEGLCAPGAVETETSPLCGERSRICDDMCAWRAWTVATPDGVCMPGETRMDVTACDPSSGSQETCQTDCSWGAPSCVYLCGGTARTMPADAEEVCVPAGPFIRGTTSWPNTQPVAEVTLSAYYIDKYPVTNERYAACVAAGVCAVPGAHPAGSTSLADPTRGRYPVQAVRWAQADAFCRWDGRRLPTSAEWEKAARGPAPRNQPYVWDGPDYRCDLLYSAVCGWVWDLRMRLITHRVDGFPGTQSYYGVEGLLGLGYSWTQDLYLWDSGYYADPASLVDPQGTTTGSRVSRGVWRGQDVPRQYEVGTFRQSPTGSGGAFSIIRCARSAPAVGTP